MNKLPEVKRFIKNAGHADSYENVKITFIAGHAPVLILRDEADVQVEKIDLSKYTTDGLVWFYCFNCDIFAY